MCIRDRGNAEYMGKIDKENCFLARLTTYDESSDSGLIIFFEFVTTYKHGDKIVEMCCAWTSLPIKELRSTRKHKLDLQGGAPSRIKVIQREDVRTARTSWRLIVKQLGSNITSSLSLEINAQASLPSDIRPEIDSLPSRILVSMNSLNLISTFREYLGSKVTPSPSYLQDIEQDLVTKTMRRCIDCHDIFYRLTDFWHIILRQTHLKGKGVPLSVECLVQVLETLNPVSYTHLTLPTIYSV
eukprot:TRINITY_DN5231_c0_g1_i4.p1 TRINITY_DN5231_c0_g1~~TRINITY_DN5231_c0_g1_i4.p1  ORF type:complete len:262 (-),score=70.10 TRINITY_DN5231_c0_g1_i4:34-759(-)